MLVQETVIVSSHGVATRASQYEEKAEMSGGGGLDVRRIRQLEDISISHHEILDECYFYSAMPIACCIEHPDSIRQLVSSLLRHRLEDVQTGAKRCSHPGKTLGTSRDFGHPVVARTSPAADCGYFRVRSQRHGRVQGERSNQTGVLCNVPLSLSAIVSVWLG